MKKKTRERSNTYTQFCSSKQTEKKKLIYSILSASFVALRAWNTIFTQKTYIPKETKNEEEKSKETHQNSHMCFIKHFHFGLPARVPMYGCIWCAYKRYKSLSHSRSLTCFVSVRFLFVFVCERVLRSEAATWFVWHWLKNSRHMHTERNGRIAVCCVVSYCIWVFC